MVTIERRDMLAGMVGLGAAAAMPAWAARIPYPPLPQPDPKLWHIDTPPAREGFATGPAGRLYHRIYGKPGRTPVLVLHGGPAGGETYMRPYAGLATDREVVLYDQSGCGRSDGLPRLEGYTLDHYVAEVEALRRQLGYEKVVLLGHSWGGILAPAYAQKYPDRVAALVLAGTAVRWRDFELAVPRWLKELGPEAEALVARANAGKVAAGDPAYEKLMMAYYQRHLCRLDPWPDFFVKAGEAIGHNPVYAYLNGPSEFQFTGAFGGLDMTDALRSVRVPTLVTCGEYDEGPPEVAAKIVALVKGAKLTVFDGLSHMSHIEDPARVVSATHRFIAAV